MLKQVLIIEDDIALRRLFTSVLEFSGCIVSEADSCAAARDYLALQSFDIIISDVHLPDGDAVSVMESLCADNQTVVAISSDDSYIKPLRALGIAAFMVKPVAIADLRTLAANLDKLQDYRTIWYPH
jgi:DNA-binding response OmpR family regulator